MKRILVAGVGNIFLGDDGFGSEVARRLSGRAQPDGVQVVDYGIRGYDLTYALLESWDAVVLVDAVRRGAAPGTLFVIEPEAGGGSTEPVLDAHGMDPERVLSAVAALGGELDSAPTWTDPIFGLAVPERVEGVPDAVLRPREAWKSTADYDDKAAQLADMFAANFEKYESGVDEAVRSAGPRRVPTR